jgi:steroid delta-isomerase-like uncharacterized protein
MEGVVAMSEQALSLIHRFMDAFEGPNSAPLDELLTADFALHDPEAPILRGPRQVRELIIGLRKAFPDLKFEVHDIFAREDRAAVRWTARGTHRGEFMGARATDRAVEIEGTEIPRVEGEKIVEDWVIWDALGVLRQLGVTCST